VMSGAAVPAAGVVPANADGSCPPCATGGTVMPVGYETAEQTPACPPGP
jgi:hypothetical protein